ncbi:MAG: methylmalonyl-CoA epimerase [Bacteriovoracaceae bacterium]|nr:methylmalonyl-CoA epimerase [Bacteriovoracaceae bacterium]
MIKKIDHLGIAVKSLDDAIPFYEQMLGKKCEKIEDVPEQKVRTAFISCGEVLIELLEATSDESPIAKFIEKKGEGIHHIAYLSDDLESEMKRVEEDGIRLIDKTPRGGAGDMNIAFLHPKSTKGVLTELCEPKK